MDTYLGNEFSYGVVVSDILLRTVCTFYIQNYFQVEEGTSPSSFYICKKYLHYFKKCASMVKIFDMVELETHTPPRMITNNTSF